jgi:MOSC domain-containing protein YiiM
VAVDLPTVGAVVGLFVGRPQTMDVAPVGSTPISDDDEAVTGTWTSAIAKRRCDGPVFLGEINLDGDDQADRRVHGGPDKAVCVYPAAHYPAWWGEADWPDRLGPDSFRYGAFGENLTVAGMTEDTTCIGDVLRVGGATVEVSQPRSPCWKLGRRWSYPQLTARTRDTDRTGWYVRVLDTGVVAPDAPIELLDRPFPEWTVTEVNRVHIHERDDLEAAARLAACPALAESWSGPLRRRVERRR